jgi:hypothetical protein
VVSAIALLAFLVPAGAWIATARSLGRPAVNQVAPTGQSKGHDTKAGFNVRGFASYIRQFYLPRLPGTHRNIFPHTLPVYSVWLIGSWGKFGWRQFRLPPRAFYAIALALVLVLVGLVLAIRSGNIPRDRALAVFFALAAVALLAVLHVTEYRVVFITHSRADFNQGRYLLPLVSLLGVGVAGALTVLKNRWRLYAISLVLAGLLTLQLLSLVAHARWFYA